MFNPCQVIKVLLGRADLRQCGCCTPQAGRTLLAPLQPSSCHCPAAIAHRRDGSPFPDFALHALMVRSVPWLATLKPSPTSTPIRSIHSIHAGPADGQGALREVLQHPPLPGEGGIQLQAQELHPAQSLSSCSLLCLCSLMPAVRVSRAPPPPASPAVFAGISSYFQNFHSLISCSWCRTHPGPPIRALVPAHPHHALVPARAGSLPASPAPRC